MNEQVIGELVNFFIVAIIFLIAVAVIFKIFCKNFKFSNKNIELYGLLLNLNASSLISISAITIQYLFLVWCTITFQGLNIVYVSIILLLVVISEAILDNFGNLPISLLLAVVDCASVEVIYLIYNYVTNEYFSYILLLILFLVILFVFLYYTFQLFRRINNIVTNNKYLKKKKYKV